MADTGASTIQVSREFDYNLSVLTGFKNIRSFWYTADDGVNTFKSHR